ncbi:MAG: hypothetical protein IJ345_02145 [Clostridia bacterium]|nr:hypothetical protein [Clostridia bacterium]
MNKQSPKTIYLSFNTYLIIYLIAMIIFGAFAAMFFADGDAWGIFFMLIALIPIFIIVVSPLRYEYSKKSVTIVYVLGDREIIPWTSVRNITLYGSWISHLDCLPYYQVAYGHKKQKFYMNGEIIKSRKNKKLIEKFYGGTIL